MDEHLAAGDPVARPEFLEKCIRELVDVRNELSEMWAEQYGNPTAIGKPERLTVSKYERDELYHRQRRELEVRESELVAKINQYKDVASLGGPAVLDDDTYVNEALGEGDDAEDDD